MKQSGIKLVLNKFAQDMGWKIDMDAPSHQTAVRDALRYAASLRSPSIKMLSQDELMELAKNHVNLASQIILGPANYEYVINSLVGFGIIVSSLVTSGTPLPKPRRKRTYMIPSTVRPMQEPLRSLVLEGMKMAGSIDSAEVLTFIEESLTPQQFREVDNFCKWLKKNSLTVGHGTISLRWDEFKSKRAPASQEAAYQWAMKRV
jgi:hypothetical protein